MLEYKGSSLFGAQPNPKLTLLASLCSPLCPPSRCPARLRSPRAWLLPGLNPETPGRATDVFSQGTARPHFLTPGTQHLKLTCQIVLDTLQPLKLRILFHPGALQKHPEPETERAHAHTQYKRAVGVCPPVHPWTDPVWLSPSLGAGRSAAAPGVPGPAHTSCRDCTSPQTPHHPGHHTCRLNVTIF